MKRPLKRSPCLLLWEAQHNTLTCSFDRHSDSHDTTPKKKRRWKASPSLPSVGGPSLPTWLRSDRGPTSDLPLQMPRGRRWRPDCRRHCHAPHWLAPPEQKSSLVLPELASAGSKKKRPSSVLAQWAWLLRRGPAEATVKVYGTYDKKTTTDQEISIGLIVTSWSYQRLNSAFQLNLLNWQTACWLLLPQSKIFCEGTNP